MPSTATAAASRDPFLTLRRVERQQRVVEILVAADAAMTTAELADRLRVAPRTIERDLARLRESGVPIRTRPGPGGGARMAVSSGSRAVELSTAEIAALLASMAALGPTATEASRTATAALTDALRPHPQSAAL